MNCRMGLLITLMLASAVVGAHAQADVGDNESKIARCREISTEIMWLDRAALRARCGAWSYGHTLKTAYGERETIVYSRYFIVYLDNNIVTAVRIKRQIFTGFKKLHP